MTAINPVTDLARDGAVAVITLNNPPVNGLGHETRLGITSGLEKAQADANVKAIVITGAGKAFSGGADIKEFGTPKALAEPNLVARGPNFQGEVTVFSPAILNGLRQRGVDLRPGQEPQRDQMKRLYEGEDPRRFVDRPADRPRGNVDEILFHPPSSGTR